MPDDVKSRVSDEPRVSVIVPTLNPGPERFRALVGALRAQVGVQVELVVVDSSSDDGTQDLLDLADVVLRIERADFDHGGTRNLAARSASGDLLAFMTQDALPADEHMLARLVAPIVRGEAAAAYARQVAPASAPLLERIARELNYPATSELRSLEDLPRLGIRTFLLSNVSSVVSREAFDTAGGFPEPALFNEDLYLSAHLLEAGGRIAYVAGAVVEHGHAYTPIALFRRYFDNAASLTSAPVALRNAPAGSRGLDFALAQARALLRLGRPDLLLLCLVENGARGLGFALGRGHRHVPVSWVRRLSLQPRSRIWARDRPAR